MSEEETYGEGCAAAIRRGDGDLRRNVVGEGSENGGQLQRTVSEERMEL